MALVIVGVVVVLLIIALPFAKRHDARKGHANRSMGEISVALRTQRGQLREARRVRYRGAAGPQRRPRPRGR